jgi:hypothetical protein
MSKRRTVIAFLTGQSDPNGNVLSAVQLDFLELAGISDARILKLNFPYGAPMGFGEKVPLIKASWNNGKQYFASRLARFSSRYRGEVMAEFADDDRVILLAGSCGLELLNNLKMPHEFLQQTHVFAYGPVSRKVPDCATLWRVQGTRDLISKVWHPQPDRVVDCHHMNYLESPETLILFLEFYQMVKNL